MAITINYSCEDEQVTICGINSGKTKSLTLSSTANCCTDGEDVTYYLSDTCSDARPVGRVALTNFDYSDDYDENTCTGWFSFHWELLLSASVVSLTGTKTVTEEGGSPVVTNITVASQLEGDLQYYLTGTGELYEFDLDFVTEEGCVINVTASFTTICPQCQCGIDLPIAGTITTTVVTDIPSNDTFTIVDGCAVIDLTLENGVNYFSITYPIVRPDDPTETVDMCILVDCDDWLCKITKKIADNILCTDCNENLDESFELFLEYQMLLSLLDCDKCCQACQLYNKIDNELSKCSSC